MNYLYPLILATALSFALTFLVRKICLVYGLVSKPRSRDIHRKPVPRLGGVAIFSAFFLISIIYFLVVDHNLIFSSSRWLGIDKHLMAIWIGAVIITISMLVDDLYNLKPWQKISFQLMAALVVIASGIGIETLTNPFGDKLNLNSIYLPIFKYHNVVYHFSLWSDLITVVWLLGMMNIINFVDGVDGLAGGVSVIAAFTVYLLSISDKVNQPQTALLAIILAGSALGFLLWNFPPAKIFMGDSGSMFLGFILGILTLISGGKLATVFLVLGFPIVDGLIVVVGRIIRRENPFTTPDKTHLHHRFLKAGYTPRQAILSIYAISAAFAWVALRSTTVNKIIAAIILIILVFILTRLLNYKIKKLP